MVPLERVQSIVAQAATGYARRTGWCSNDLVQQGWEYALRAVKRCAVVSPRDPAAFVAVSVWRGLSGYLLWAGAPTSGRTRVDQCTIAVSLAELPDLGAPPPSVDDTVALAVVRLRVLAVEIGAEEFLSTTLGGQASPALAAQRSRLLRRARRDRPLRAIWEGDAP